MPHTLFSQHFKNTSSDKKIFALCKKYADVLRAKIKDSELAAIDIISSNRDLKELEKFAKKISAHKKILVLGVGGSSLGGKTLSALKSQQKVEFLESIDFAGRDRGMWRATLLASAVTITPRYTEILIP
jgi:glucose-6-phosphate isomerase